MSRLLCATIVVTVMVGLCSTARGQDAKDAAAVIDRAIKALGGEEKLSKIKAVEWKGKGKIRFGENENEFALDVMTQGLDHVRRTFEGEFGGNPVRGVTVLAGDKGWRKFGDNLTEMDSDAVANEKRAIYLSIIPITIVPLKSKDFKVEAAGEEQVGGKPASVVKVTAADRKDFKLYFDKESGLPVKQVAEVVGFNGQPYTQETTLGEYKDLGGIKKATKQEAKRDGQAFQDIQITDFKVLDKVEAKAFAEPQ
jgi:hypothetical protein